MMMVLWWFLAWTWWSSLMYDDWCTYWWCMVDGDGGDGASLHDDGAHCWWWPWGHDVMICLDMMMTALEPWCFIQWWWLLDDGLGAMSFIMPMIEMICWRALVDVTWWWWALLVMRIPYPFLASSFLTLSKPCAIPYPFASSSPYLLYPCASSFHLCKPF